MPGTVARGELSTDELFYTGKINGAVANVFPFPITQKDLERGQQAIQHLLHALPRLHGDWQRDDRAKRISASAFLPHRPPDEGAGRPFFDVMTNGYGTMYSYAARVSPRDRWCIAAYIRALQLSQDAPAKDVPPKELQKLEGSAQ